MRAIWIQKHGGLEALVVKESPEPIPGPLEVRIRVQTAGLNFAEVMARKGLYPDAPKPPCIVGYEGAGIIDRVGASVRSLRTGQRVLFLSRFGAHAEVVCVPELQVVPIPDAMDFAVAAAIPVNYLTAWQMLFRVGRIRSGDHILIHMAAGGVGTAVLQLARSIPGVVTYGTCSQNKHAFAREQGCQHCIDYRNVDYVAEIQRLTEGRGVDYILDALGPRDWKKGYQLLRSSGMLIAFGVANINTGERRNVFKILLEMLRTPFHTPLGLMDQNKALAGVNMAHLWHETERLHADLLDIVRLWEKGLIRPHIMAEIPFADASKAYALLETGRNIGKVILRP